MDEWSQPWPIFSFKSFLDYKAPLQTYLMIPSIAIFGLNEFSARLPSAVFGILAVFTLYQLTLLLAKDYLSDSYAHKPKQIALVAALLLAISPWHIQFSRTALEASLIGFFIPAALWLYLSGQKDKRKIVLSAVLFGLSVFAYHSAKIFTPLFVTFLVGLFVYKKTFTQELKLFLIVFGVFFLPALADMVFGSSGSRGQDLLIFNLTGTEIQSISDARFYSPLFKISPSLPAIFHNKLFFIFDRFLENYLSYFNLSFWFTEGGQEITYSIIPGRGLLYTWEVILFMAAFVFFTRHYTTKRLGWLLLAWFLLAALPAAITKEGYRPNRASAYLGLFELLMALGLSYFLIKLRRFRRILVGVISFVAVLALGFYLNDYAFASRVSFPSSMAYGWREAAEYIKANEAEYDLIFIERDNQPQSFIAFYHQLDPKVFQSYSTSWAALAEQQKVDYLDQIHTYQLDRYTFKQFNFPEDIEADSLYLADANSLLPEKRVTLHIITNGPEKKLLEFFTFDEETVAANR
jgi:4-amino-4-deoxy-L-arabinose transferase-like glycosyltransferase